MKPSEMFKRKPYTELTTPAAVEALMAPGGGAGVIDFWAPWCAPCRAMAPHFEAVATQYAEQPVAFYKVNTEAHPALGEAFNVRNLPTTVFVNKGEIADVIVGAADKNRLADKVEWLLSKARGESFLDRLLGRKKSGAGTEPASNA